MLIDGTREVFTANRGDVNVSKPQKRWLDDIKIIAARKILLGSSIPKRMENMEDARE